MASQPKRVTEEELRDALAVGEWKRLQGLDGALPPGVHLPPEKLHHVTVSGSLDLPRLEPKGGEPVEVVGAWDVFRFDPKDAPFNFNKDHYFALRRDGENGPEYWLHGPLKKSDPQHWLKEIPDEFSTCDLLVPREGSEDQ